MKELTDALQTQLASGVKSLQATVNDIDPKTLSEQILGYSDNQAAVAWDLEKIETDLLSLASARDLLAKQGSEASEEETKAVEKEIEQRRELLRILIASGKLQGENAAKAAELYGQTSGAEANKVNMADVTTSAIRAASALSAMTNGMDGLIESIKTGNVSFGSLVGSFGSIWRGAQTATKAFSSMGEMLASSTGLAGALGKAFTFLSGHIFAVIAVIGALVIAFKLLKKAQEDAYKRSTAGQIEANNEALAKQKTIVQGLVSEYENLTSTVEHLQSAYDALNEMEPGTAKYLLAAQQYNDELDEIAKKYGDVFNYDEAGNRTTINQDLLDATMLRQMYSAQAEQQRLQNRGNELAVQQAHENINKGRGAGVALEDEVTSRWDNELQEYVTETKSNRLVSSGKSSFIIEDKV